MLQLIAFIIFVISSVAIALILHSTIPALVKLPKNGHHGIKKNKAIAAIEKKWKTLHFDFFKKQVWLHRTLSKSRVWVLKLERKLGDLLHGLRKKAQELDKEVKEK